MAIDVDALITVTVAPGQPNETPRRTPEQLLPAGRTTVMTIEELATLIGVGTGGGFPIALIQDQKNAASGGTFTAGAPRTRDLNTIVRNDITGLTLNANRFTLPEGIYVVEASCPGLRVVSHQAWLVEDPAGSPTIILHGTSQSNINDTTDGSDGPGRSVIVGVVTAGAGGVEYEIQHQCSVTKTTNGFGNVGQFQNNPSIFTNVKITQLVEGP